MTQSDVPEGSRRLRRICRFILLSKGQKTKRETSPEAFRWLRKAICFGPDAISSNKKRADEAQEVSKMNLEAFFSRSRGPRKPPRHAQELPKRPRESPKTLPKPCSDRNRRFVENVNIQTVKQSFLKVGRVSLGAKNPSREVPKEERTVPRPSLAPRSEQTRPKRVPK